MNNMTIEQEQAVRTALTNLERELGHLRIDLSYRDLEAVYLRLEGASGILTELVESMTGLEL